MGGTRTTLTSESPGGTTLRATMLSSAGASLAGGSYAATAGGRAGFAVPVPSPITQPQQRSPRSRSPGGFTYSGAGGSYAAAHAQRSIPGWDAPVEFHVPSRAPASAGGAGYGASGFMSPGSGALGASRAVSPRGQRAHTASLAATGVLPSSPVALDRTSPTALPVSPNLFASQASLRYGSLVVTDRTTTRVSAPAGGHSTVVLG
jgi:hypothetical protein